MTLRKLIYETGVHKKRVRNLKRLQDFRAIENCDIVVSENIPKEDLFKYFNSEQFKEDVSAVMNGINITIKKYHNYSLEPKNFCLFFSETNPLKLNAHALLF